MKAFYYQFWLQSSRGTNASHVTMYKEKPHRDKLKADCEEWCSGFGAWHVSENCCSYGWKEIKNLPKNRRDCIAKHSLAHQRRSFWGKRVSLYAGLLSWPPFNGAKAK